MLSLLLLVIFACAAPQQQLLQTEKDYQIAFNEAYFHGKAKMEVPVKYGRIDLLTADYAIEVDRLENFYMKIDRHTGVGRYPCAWIPDLARNDRRYFHPSLCLTGMGVIS